MNKVTRKELAEALKSSLSECERLRNLIGGLTAKEINWNEMKGILLLSRLEAEREQEPATQFVGRWISVEDRLPETFKPVLVKTNLWGNDDDIFYGEYVADRKANGRDDTWRVVDVWGEYNEPYQFIPGSSITHWMPLPEPPADAEAEPKPEPDDEVMAEFDPLDKDRRRAADVSRAVKDCPTLGDNTSSAALFGEEVGNGN